MWWHVSEDSRRLICDLCPRQCNLKAGERGFCFVRENRDGRIVSSTYGRNTGLCVDPIEKKPLYQFYPGTSALSFGTPGCNLGCIFCQNWTLSRSHEIETVCRPASPRMIADAARQHGCRSVAFTYNDPIVWAEYAIDTAKECSAVGIQSVAVTSGYISAIARAEFFEPMNAANIDLKGFSDSFYRHYCNGRLQPVLDTLSWLVHQSSVWVEITNLVIPEANDSPTMIRSMCQWIMSELGPKVPLHFSSFHPDFQMTDRPSTSAASLRAAYDIAREAGLHYVYTGNVIDPERQHTYCPSCGEAVIRRTGYSVQSFDIQNGRCIHCQTPIAGRFDETANPRRQRKNIKIEN